MTEKNYIIIVAIFLGIFAIAGGIVGFSVLGEDAISEETLKLEEQNLYELEKNTTKDLESLMGNENISIDISSKDKIILTFKEEHSALKVTYTTEYVTLEEDFTCSTNQILANVLVTILGILIGIVAGMLALCIILPVWFYIEGKIEERKALALKQKDEKKKREINVQVHQV